MAEVARKRLVDGFSTLQGGVDEGKSPSLLATGEAFSGSTAARLINGTVRGGFLTNRPPFQKIKLHFESGEDCHWFRTHNVQGREFYHSATKTFLIVSIGGRIYRIDPSLTNAVNVSNIGIPGDDDPSIRPHAWMVQAEKYLIIQDGQSTPLIYDGASMRRASTGAPTLEVPVGTAMAYGLGRLIVVLPHRRAYIIGDLVHGGTEVIQFTEDSYLNEGGSVNVPIPGEITAVKIIAQLDRSVGQGDLMVFTRFGAASARIGADRATWKQIQFQSVVLLGMGATSQESIVLVNGDMFYRRPDGLGSLAMTRREFQQSWATTPISNEVQWTLSFDTDRLTSFCQATLFDNRLLLLCNQTPLTNGCLHRGMVALDFDLITGMAQKLAPAYDGLWGGLNFTALIAGDFSGTERCFVMHRRASDGRNELWELLKTGHLDDGKQRIQWTVESPAVLKGGSTQQSLKKLDGGDISMEAMRGPVDWTVQFRPDQAPCWFDWHRGSACATVADCAGCPQPVQPQYRTKKRFPQPPDGCSVADNKPSRMGYEFQGRITIQGGATLRMMRLTATEFEEPLGEIDGCALE